MNLRILSFAALTGMLAAAGCGSGTGSGIAPTVGNSTGSGAAPSSAARGTLSASFDIPKRYLASSTSSTSSSAREPQYVSPGSSGIEVILTNTGALGATAGTPTWIIGQKSAPVALVGTPGAIFNGNALSSNVGFGSASTVTYSYQPSSTLANYYTFTLTVPNLAVDHYTLGVVLTDIANHNFVLSEGQTLTANVSSATAVTPVNLTLASVVDKAYLVGPALVAIAGIDGTHPLAPAYEFTLYAADETGYVINEGGGTNTFDGQTLSVAQSLPVVTSTSPTTIAVGEVTAGLGTVTYPTTGGTNPIPIVTAGDLLTSTVSFSDPGSATTIAAPAGGLPNQGPIYLVNSAFKAGIPILVQNSTATGSVQVSAYLTSPLAGSGAGTVTGYSYVPGTNFPVGALSSAAYPVGTPGTVNFTPGLYPIIQSKTRN